MGGTLGFIDAGSTQGRNRSGLLWFLLPPLWAAIATFILVTFCGKVPEVTSWRAAGGWPQGGA